MRGGVEGGDFLSPAIALSYQSERHRLLYSSFKRRQNSGRHDSRLEMAATLQVCQRDLITCQRALVASQQAQVYMSEQINQLLKRGAALEAFKP